MDVLHRRNAAPIARALNVILTIASVILGVLFVLMVAIGFLSLTSSGAQSSILSDFISIEAMTEGTSRHVFLSCFGVALIIAAYFVVITLLRRLVRTLLEGDPFVPENISRLRWIWIILALAEVARMIGTMGLLSEESDTMIDIRFGAWFLVFVIAALAEVFRHGTELRRDAELTV